MKDGMRLMGTEKNYFGRSLTDLIKRALNNSWGNREKKHGLLSYVLQIGKQRRTQDNGAEAEKRQVEAAGKLRSDTSASDSYKLMCGA